MSMHAARVLPIVLLAVACGSDVAGPISRAEGRGDGSNTLIAGRVVRLTPPPDSSTVPVARAEVLVFFVDTIPSDTMPVDTLPTDTIPGDSVLIDPLAIAAHSGRFLLDTIPGDTIPVDTIPGDSTPPPPPPPPVGCGRTGELVARARTTRDGGFRIVGLPPAKYDLKVVPPRGSNLGTSFYCGVHLLEGQPAHPTIYLFPVRDSLTTPARAVPHP